MKQWMDGAASGRELLELLKKLAVLLKSPPQAEQLALLGSAGRLAMDAVQHVGLEQQQTQSAIAQLQQAISQLTADRYPAREQDLTQLAQLKQRVAAAAGVRQAVSEQIAELRQRCKATPLRVQLAEAESLHTLSALCLLGPASDSELATDLCNCILEQTEQARNWQEQAAGAAQCRHAHAERAAAGGDDAAAELIREFKKSGWFMLLPSSRKRAVNQAANKPNKPAASSPAASATGMCTTSPSTGRERWMVG